MDNLSEKALLGRAVRSQQALNRSEIKYNKYKIKQLKKKRKVLAAMENQKMYWAKVLQQLDVVQIL